MSTGRLVPGQSIKTAISARALNRAQDAADIVLGGRLNVTADAQIPIEKVSNIVLVRNDSSHDVPRLGVLGIDGIAIDPSGGTLEGENQASVRAREFARRPVLSGVTPTRARHANTFVVLLEPCEANAIAPAAASGCFAVRLQIENEAHSFATVRNGDRTQLASTSCGVMQLLWKQTGTGQNKWAVGVM